VATGVDALGRRILCERDAYRGEAEGENGHGKGLAKIHEEILRRESYARKKKRVKRNMKDGYASFEAW